MGPEKAKKCEHLFDVNRITTVSCYDNLTDHPRVPKTTACFNCTRRRIVCDLTLPKCNKCAKKGIECPGYGIRYRFTSGKTASPSEIGPQEVSEPVAEQVRRRSDLKWVDVTSRLKKKKRGEVAEGSTEPSSSGDVSDSTSAATPSLDETRNQLDMDEDGTPNFDVPTTPNQHLVPYQLQTALEQQIPDSPLQHEDYSSPTLDDGQDIEDIDVMRDDWDDSPMILSHPVLTLQLPPLLSNLDPRMRMLFNHCTSVKSLFHCLLSY